MQIHTFYRTFIVLIALILSVAGCGRAETDTATEPAETATDAGMLPTETVAPAATDPAASPATETAVPPTATEASIATEPASPTEAATETPAPTEPPAATATPAPIDQLSLVLEPVAEGFTAPTAFAVPDDGSGRFFVTDQIGLIWVVTPDGGRLSEPFLDVRDRLADISGRYDERGLLGLALHPNYAENGRFFVYYSAPPRPEIPGGWNHTSHLSEFRVSANDPNRADPGSERIVLPIDQPQPNHNGGQLAFGPDGYLYVGLGDGGAANDQGTGHPPLGNGQDRSTILGSILRLDVDGGEPYAIPPDNPFVDDDGADEIFAYGFRNPYRFSFDAGSDNALYAGDVGQNLYEEVDIVTRGDNYGWNIKEGTHCFNPDSPSNPPAECPDTGPNGEPLVDPVIEYDHSQGISVISGYVYRGSAIPALTGRYVFADWSADSRLFVADPAMGDGLWDFEVIEPMTDTPFPFLLAFGQDTERELYLLTSESGGPSGQTGRLYRLVSGP